MVTLLHHLLRLLPTLCGGHRQVALENLALRHQLAVYKKMVKGRSCSAAIDCSGSRCPGCGPAGGKLSSSCHPTPSCGGSAAASASTGPDSPPGPPAVARPSAPRSKPWSAEWSRRIHSYTRSVLSRRSGGETSCPGNKEQKEEGQA